jgi:hypothetical protein
MHVEAPPLSFTHNQNKYDSGADIVTCDKFGLEPAEQSAASAALFFDSNAARNWLNLY